jgi:hypothetical protein
MPRPRLPREGKRQRFYARNALKTTLDAGHRLDRCSAALGRSMRSFWATRAYPHYPTHIHPALNNFADECCAVLARLLAYVGTLAILAVAGIHLWNQLPTGDASEPRLKAGWHVASRPHPAFAVSQIDLPEKTATYEVFRHPEGGRKDVLRWSVRDAKQIEKPVAELEIYRPGGEFNPSEPAIPQSVARMEPSAGREREAAEVIESKFGPVMLLRPAGATDDSRACLDFVKRLDEPHLQISGWSCQGDTVSARRAAIGCILNRLVLLTAGNDPKLAELFARAELKRSSCAAAAAAADWVTSADNPRLRGTL